MKSENTKEVFGFNARDFISPDPESCLAVVGNVQVTDFNGVIAEIEGRLQIGREEIYAYDEESCVTLIDSVFHLKNFLDGFHSELEKAIVEFRKLRNDVP